MNTVEDYIAAFTRNRCNVEPLFLPSDESGDIVFGVRIRPWGDKLRGKMVLGSGDTLLQALESAWQKAGAGRWEPLDWAKRPWAAPSEGWYA